LFHNSTFFGSRIIHILHTGCAKVKNKFGILMVNPAPPQPPKISSAKIRWRSSRLDFLGSIQNSPHQSASKGPNYQLGVLLIPTGAIEGLLKEKLHGKYTKVVLFLHDRQRPGSPGTCNPEETGLPRLQFP
jgi:hypothetical protein